MLADPKYLGAYSQIKPAPYKFNIVGFDTEDNSAGEVISYAFYDGGKHTGEKGFYYTTSNEDALRFILEYPETSVFFAHNLEYDINNIFKQTDFRYIDEEITTPKLIKATLLGSKNYFMNSNAFFFSTLRKMGEIIGLPKLEGDEQDRFNPNYVIRDAEIVYRYMVGFQDTIHNNHGIKLRATIGSLAMSIFRTQFMQVKKQVTFNNPEILKGYYGGRTEIFYKGVIDKPIKIVDINSSYPNVMVANEYPDTATLSKSTIKTHKFGVGKFKIYVPEDTTFPVLPYRSDTGKLFFPVGTMTGYWTYAEIREAIKQGAKIKKEYDGVGTNVGCKPFSEFIHYFYNTRLECKELIKKLEKIKNRSAKEEYQLQKAKMDSEVLKYIMNNLYGKMAQHKSNAIRVRRPLTEGQLEYRIKGEYKLSRLGCFYEYKPEVDTPALTSNYLWGVYVTAYARLDLHKHIMTIHNAGGLPLYSDTDSVMYAGDLPEGTLDLGSDLGQLEYESYNRQTSFDVALFRQAKGYLICNKTGKKKNGLQELEIVKSACKGVPSAYSYDFILKNMATFDKPMRQREFFISATAKNSKLKRALGLNVWDEVTKTQNLEYLKRKGEGVTVPVNVNEIEALEENASGIEVKSYEGTIQELGYSILKKEVNQIFTKVKIPDGWIKNYPKEDSLEWELSSQKQVLLKTVHYRELPEDTVWFSGYITGFTDDKYGSYVNLNLTQFEGDILPFTGLTARINIRVFKKLGILKKEGDSEGTLITITKIDDEETKIEAIKDGKLINFKLLNKKEKERQNKKLLDYLIKKGKYTLSKS